MCDIKKYGEIFEEIKKLNPDDTLQLVLESKTEEEKNFTKWLEIFSFRKNKKNLWQGMYTDEKICDIGRC